MTQPSLFLYLLFLPSLLSAAEPVQRPVIRNRSYWQFQVSQKEWITDSSAALHPGLYELRATQGRVLVFKLSDGAKQVIRGSEAGELRTMLGTFKGKQALIEFPLFEGKSWKTEFRKAKGRLEHTDHLVTGKTIVTTPAGSFEALRIERDDRDFKRVRTREYYYVVECACLARYSMEIKSAPTYWPPKYFGKREITLVKFGSLN